MIIAGFGRVGQIVARMLNAHHIPFAALEHDAEQVDFVRRFGNQVFYGDATRLDLLRAAQADKAEIFVHRDRESGGKPAHRAHARSAISRTSRCSRARATASTCSG